MSAHARAPLDAPRRPRGRPPSRSWAFFTTVVEPQKLPSAVCRHCHELVHHRHKWGQARTHLMKCPQFRHLMDTIPANEKPAWFLVEAQRRQHALLQSQPNKSTVGPPTFPTYQVSQAYTYVASSVPDMPPLGEPLAMETRDHFMSGRRPRGRNNNNRSSALDEQVAMHLFTAKWTIEEIGTGRAELSSLLVVLQTCGPEFVVPDHEQLMTALLDRCVERVQQRVDALVQADLIPATLLVDETAMPMADGTFAQVVHYMTSLASFEQCPLYLESVVARRGDHEQMDAEWKAADVSRVVEKLSHPVAGCVVACSSPESRQLRRLLEKKHPGMYFHGCMRDALWSLVCDILTTSGTSENECNSSLMPLVQEIQQFALQCKDLAFFLPPPSDELALDMAVESSKTVIHVSLTRRLTVHEAFFAILQAEAFLDDDNGLHPHLPAGSNGHGSGALRFAHDQATVGHLQTELIGVVRSSQFVQTLRKFLGVLRPVHKLLQSLTGGANATPLLLSEVHSCFSRLEQQYASSTQLLPEEKRGLQALVRQRQEFVMGPAHHLALLLDPVVLGGNLPVNTKAELEQKLVSSRRADGTSLSDVDKSALRAQYMDFKKFAMSLKTSSKTETLGFRLPKERRLLPLQFWLTDGTRWPLLQAIACRVFVMPVCTVSSLRVFSEADVALRSLWQHSDYPSRDKLAFVRVNTHQLDVAETVGSSLAMETQKPQTEINTTDITASMVV